MGAAAAEPVRLEELWERYCCRLLAFISKRVSDQVDAEDILQEVFIRVHRSLCCPPARSRIESWIYQVTRNLIVDHYRRRRTLAEIPEDLPAPAEPEDDDPRSRLAFSLRDMVEELPAPYSEALILTEYEGMSQKDLARRLGISASGAKSRVQRARRRLRDLLLACCHFELDRMGRVIDYYARCCCCNPSATGRRMTRGSRAGALDCRRARAPVFRGACVFFCLPASLLV